MISKLMIKDGSFISEWFVVKNGWNTAMMQPRKYSIKNEQQVISYRQAFMPF